jgi:RES domain-containing protein
VLLEETVGGRYRLAAFRLAAWDTPFWTNPNRRDGRYNRAGEAPTQYLALHPLTPWAELLRFDGRVTEAESQELRLPLWTFFFDLAVEEVLRITFDNASDYGLGPEDLVADDYGSCQAFAAGLREGSETSANVLVVPSAALPGTENLVILAPRVVSPYDVKPIQDVDVATSLAAVRARPPYGLAAFVHHKSTGTRHAGLEAWESGDEAPEPIVRWKP